MRRFYNPDLSDAEIETLDWENWLTLQTVQAFLGDISDNFLGIAVEPRADAATVHVALRHESADDAESVRDALGDLDALLEGRVTLDECLVVGTPDVGRWTTSGLRLVFLRRP